jgi:alpha-1,3(6)-mannosylglycoprotein beta-1,6-N-acetyl-glucosaminyltransferase
MQEQDIFIIYASFPDKIFHKDFKLLGNDLITHAWIDDEHLIWCFQDPQSCVQSPQNPEGVCVHIVLFPAPLLTLDSYSPLWKMFAFTFWGSLPKSGK